MSSAKQVLRLRIIGGCHPDERALIESQAILRADKLRLVNDSSATIVLYNLEDTIGEAGWRNRELDQPGVTHVAFTAGAAPTDAEYFLRRPLRAFQLIEFLSSVEMGGGAAAESAKAAAPQQKPTPVFEPASRLLGLLRTGSSDGSMSISLGDAPEIVVSPQSGKGFSVDWPLLANLARAPIESIVCRELQQPEIEAAVSRGGLAERDLNQLIWFAALQGSEGRPLETVDPGNAMRLRRLPDLVHLFHRSIHIRIALIMARRALRVDEIAKTAGVPIADVVDYCNACACLDLVEVTAGAPSVAIRSRISSERSGLFKRIMKRLSQPEGTV